MRLPLLLALILPLPTLALPGSYEAEVAVADRSEQTRLAALRDALALLLFRLSGTPGLEADPGVRMALARPERLLRGFVYLDGEAAAAVDPEQRLALRASFIPEEVLRLLEEARAPIWFGPRPAVLVLLDDGADEASPAWVRDDHPLASAFRRAARALSYPLVFPHADPVEDRRIADLFLRREGFAPLAERYAVRVVLAGRLSRNLAPGRADWLLWQADRAASHSEAVMAEEVAAPAMALLHRWLASRYAAPPAERVPERFPLAVAGIHGGADYLALMALLRQHGLLLALRPERALGDRLVLSVEARVRRARALELLRLDPRLEVDPRPLRDLPAESQLLWLP